LFQFQSGAIESNNATVYLAGMMTFQFQSGAIERRKREENKKKENKSFNSNLVRLKGGKRKKNEVSGAEVSIPIWCD